ncbi:protease HtpX [Xylella fastidiosa subsp. fastidiosa]|jgi:heat shock protein HtpX|uniref:Protease HtpX n=3 Tax=Xylella fastidiosa TaxID=2371 RepID=HTPX_XYLFT|nr:protease HtpX [Xylella fastidiosa]B2IA62.1 RecName: Full=Protease HtpX; AltName: Full=Heat shock protein HtpX [Xylella fastidiosa M23]Q87A36.1 RecName: Full=Protease HtpX; AltName: Full=Heat shock protein HtpX [Xylella fastidiosa Temecula1]ADN62864.1 heat shock protein HtpX [Xylella fastidiosa subsp. fastidiosa GB514]KAF0570886.1 heat shock protein HtpX [Xylella fastidiosa subsp. fastidiosa Mus-1]AAO29824.1 heat shock protein [Xylella fastidiosa Temecula1]ACB93498.1 HtpX domain protein [Xy
MLTRIVLFAITNIAVLILASIVMSLLGVNPTQMSGLLVMALILGFGGSLISLLMSKAIAKHTTGAYVIEQPRNPSQRWLLDTVRRQAEIVGIGMPEVAIYEGPEINAFATGADRNNALVAVSTGLLQNMSQDEAEAVLGHEIAHVANGDMVTMALLQGVLNTFVIVLARVVGGFIDSLLSGNRGGGRGVAYYGIVLVLELLFGLFATIITMWFSRRREFRADEGGAYLAGRNKMIAALERLGINHGQSTLPTQVQAFGIYGGIGEGLRKLFLSHPPLSERIAALRMARE